MPNMTLQQVYGSWSETSQSWDQQPAVWASMVLTWGDLAITWAQVLQPWAAPLAGSPGRLIAVLREQRIVAVHPKF
jgi:hypothetical protein